MKPRRGTADTNQSCSCTSCLYNSESDRPSMINFVTRGSKVNKSYYGKNIPLRERNLLEKLVRTRAVYDDIRKQLLFESNVSISDKANLKPRKHAPKEADNIERSSAILQLVDLVDKGAALGPKKLSECCSCCSCSSKLHLHNERFKIKRIYSQPRAYLMSKSSEITRHRHLEEPRLRRGVRFRAKHIRSDPCTCTLKFTSLIRGNSKAILSKRRAIHSRPLIEPKLVATDEIAPPVRRKETNQYKLKKTLGTSKTRLKESFQKGTRKSLKKIRYSKAKLRGHIESGARQSVEKLKRASNKIKSRIEDMHTTYTRIPVPKIECECEDVNEIINENEKDEDNKVFKIKKDSITKFKDKLKRREQLNEYACEPECVPEECIPEECFKINTARKARQKKILDHQYIGPGVKGHTPSSTSNASIQAQQEKRAMVTNKNNKREKKMKTNENICQCEQILPKTKSIQSTTNIETTTLKPSTPILKQKMKSRSSILLRHLSSEETKRHKKNMGSAGHALKRCFCTLKIKPKKIKPNINIHRSPTSRSVMTSSQLETSHKPMAVPKLLPFECKPFYCKPGECDPVECYERIKMRSDEYQSIPKSKARRTHSTSSNTSKSLSTESVQSVIPSKIKKIENYSQKELVSDRNSPKQVVRISSTFSVNIEFTKENKKINPEVINSKSNNRKRDYGEYIQHKNAHKRKKRARHRKSQVSSTTGNSRYNLAKHSLRRCYCTLKFGLTRKKNRNLKTSKATVTSNKIMSHVILTEPRMISNSIETNRNKKEKHKTRLLPYECEPGVCTPNECNPYECLNIINQREIHLRRRQTKHSNTDYHKNRSTSSLTSQNLGRRTQKVQSNTIAYKTEINTKYRENLQNQPVRIKPRRAVKITSSCSFNIEFSKENPSYSALIKKQSEIINAPIKNAKLNHAGFQRNLDRHHKSTFMQIQKRDTGILSSSGKRCFCTLKLHKGPNKYNILANTEMKEKEILPKVLTKATNTKPLKYKKLKSYECEPYICVPGECDPYECLERIKKRQNSISKEFGSTTQHSKTRSVSSITEQLRKSKDALAQTKLKRRRVYIKSGKDKKITLPISASSSEVSQSSKQAVRIGSTFSFNIEFSRSKRLEDQLKNVPRESLRSIKKFKSRGAKANIVSMTNQNLQVIEAMKVNKAALIKPMLKRCFCNLKLQNKNNELSPNVYTISRLIVTDTKISRKGNILLNNRDSHQQAADASRYDCQFKDMQTYFQENRPKSMDAGLVLPKSHISSTLKLSREVKLRNYCTYSEACFTKTKEALKSICFNEDEFQNNFKTQYMYMKSSTNFSIRSDITGVCPLLKRCFCTMNIQLPERKKSCRPFKRKLKPYECEPGVCIPDECDPYECQKLIMKRLMRKTSKMAGTDVKLKSSHTSQSTSSSKAKKLQSGHHNAQQAKKRVPTGITYKSIPIKKNKSPIRIGSNFSFNIEFFKDYTEPNPAVPPSRTVRPSTRSESINAPHVKVKKQGTKDFPDKRHDRDSQSVATRTEEKLSNTTPLYKRCFCTLKLQKTGKHQMAQMLNQGTMTQPSSEKEIIKIATINTGQNTKAVKQEKLLHALLPYECEPGTCVPYECNPYECFKRINLRNKKIETKEIRSKSLCSITPSQRIKAKNKHFQTHFNEKPAGFKGNSEKHKQTKSSHIKCAPRQAVRIGSSFNFNIEFYKDKNSLQNNVEPAAKSSTPLRIIKAQDKMGLQTKVKLKEQGSQDPKPLQNRIAQSGGGLVKSTMTTSLVKRCFCTAKLFGIDTKLETKPALQTKQLAQLKQTPQGKHVPKFKSFLHKCLCTLKLSPKEQLTELKVGKEILTQTDKTKKEVIVNGHDKFSNLSPYECEPGICVPGECDAHACYKRIHQRNKRYDSKLSGTEKTKVKSTLSGQNEIKSTNLHHVGKTQSITVKPIQAKHTRLSQAVTLVKTPYNSSSSGRQAVKISSNFSFGIEFFNNKIPSASEVQVAANSLKIKSLHKKTETSKAHKSHRSQSQGFNMLGHGSQSLKRLTVHKGVGTTRERCFCTLKLKKNNFNDVITTAKFTDNPKIIAPNTHDRGVMATMKYKQPLESYECEPNVCIPGMCDPYECLERIQKRNKKLREFGTLTKHKTKSASSMVYSSSDSRSKKIQFAKKPHTLAKAKNIKPQGYRPKKSLDGSVYKSRRQAVSFGSNISFDLEFSKDVNVDDAMESVENINLSTKRLKDRYKMSQSAKPIRHRDSQASTRKMQDKFTGVNPVLKRCFCTLKFQKSNDTLSKQMIKSHDQNEIKIINKSLSVIGKSVRNKKVYLATIHNRNVCEHESRTCFPYECEPHECQKRLKKMMKSNIPRTNKQKIKKSTKDHKSTKPKRPKQAEPNNKRQVFKIGSNLGFDIEFYKRSFSTDLQVGKTSEESKPLDALRKKVERNKNGAGKQIARLKQNKVKNVAVDGKKDKSHGEISQEKLTGTTNSRVGPLIEKCICTLKLQKIGKRQKQMMAETKSIAYPRRKMLDPKKPGNSIAPSKTKENTKKYDIKLTPNECEPYMCNPCECDIYECYERRKHRQFNNISPGVTCKSKGIQSTNNKKIKMTNTEQAMNDKIINPILREPFTKNKAKIEKSNKTKGKKKIEKEKKPDEKIKTHILKEARMHGDYRQVARIASSFSFNIEFFKDRSPNLVREAETKIKESIQKEKQVLKKVTEKKNNKELKKDTSKKNDKGLGKDKTNKTNNENLEPVPEINKIKTPRKETAIRQFIKRCFCLIKSKKAKSQVVEPRRTLQPVQVKGLKKTKPLQEKRSVNEMKKTCKQAKMVKITEKNLLPYECEPNICISGQCNPHECLERINKREIRKISKSVGTQNKSGRENGAQANVVTKNAKIDKKPNTGAELEVKNIQLSAENPQIRVKNTQTHTEKIKPDAKKTQPNTENGIVEERRIPRLFNERQGIKIGSNISFNIEFHKEFRRYQESGDSSVLPYQKLEQSIKKTVKQDVKDNRGTLYATTNNKRNIKLQIKSEKNKNRGSEVDKFLKKCICSLQLPKSDIASPKMKNDKTIIVNRVAIEDARRILRYNNIINNNNMNKLTQKTCNCLNDLVKCNGKTEWNDIKTIYPYRPKKFNKHISKTIVCHKRDQSKKLHENKFCDGKCNKSEKIQQNQKTNHKTLTAKPSQHHIHLQNKPKSSKSTKSISHILHSLANRCMNIFSKRKLKQTTAVGPFINQSKVNKKPVMSQIDVLKTSNSERRPLRKKCTSFPKKSKSLRLTKIPENLEYITSTKKPHTYLHLGDIDQTREPALKSYIHGCRKCDKFNQFICSYCQIQYNNEPNTTKCSGKSTYADNKLVHFSLLSSGKNSRKIIGNNKRNAAHNTPMFPSLNKKTDTQYFIPCQLSEENQKVISNNNNNVIKTLFNNGGENILEKSTCLINKGNIKLPLKTTKKTKPVKETNKHVTKICAPCSQSQSLCDTGDWQKYLLEQNKKKKCGKKSVIKKEMMSVIQSEPMTAVCANDEISKNVFKNFSAFWKNRQKQPRVKNSEYKSRAINENCSSCCKNIDRKVPKSLRRGTEGRHNEVNGQQKKPADHNSLCNCKMPCTCPVCPKKYKIIELSCGDWPVSRRCIILDDESKGYNRTRGAKLTIIPKKVSPFVMKDCGYKNHITSNVKKESRERPEKTTDGNGSKDNKSKATTVVNKITKPKKKPCVCGSAICAVEAGILPPAKGKKIKQTMAKDKKKQRKKNKKDLTKQNKANAKRNKKLKKEEGRINKDIKKYSKNASNTALIAESILDIGRLGVTTSASLVRCAIETAKDPKKAVKNAKMALKNPKRLTESIKDAFNNSGFVSTFSRVGKRLGQTSGIQAIQSKMEQYAVSNYMLHIADKDPKRRMQTAKKRKKRRQAPVDFACSLFMASLRKKPCLPVYYMCPWFYPHCISFLTMWRQFIDIVLFVLAVLVWSPCILAMEICRAFVCCTFCTA